MKKLTNFFNDLKDTVSLQPEIVAESTDGFIDLVTDLEVLGEVPLVKYGVSICRIRDAYHQTKLKRNIAHFISVVSRGDQDIIQNCIAGLEESEDNGLDVADTMMSLFIDSEKAYKCEIMGNLLLALSEKEIDTNNYQNILLVVLSSSVPALKAIDKWFEATNGNPSALLTDTESPEYKNLPFMMSVGIAIHRGDDVFVNDLGKKLYDFGLKPSNNN